MSPAPRPKALDPDALAAAEEQRDFLLRSLADLEREHDAGDLTDEDYEELKDDYTARAAAAIRAIEHHEAAFADAKRARNPIRTLAIVVGVGLFAALSGIMVAKAMGARKAGESASGGVTMKLTPSQKANECNSMMGTDPTGAFECFTKVLEEDPENPVALTWSAWQLSLAAQSATGSDQALLQARAGARLEEAVKADPNYSYARAFRAVVAYRNGRYEDAKRFLAEFEERNPSTDAARIIESMDLEGKIDAALAGGGTTTSTTPSTSTPTATTLPD